MSFHKSLLIRKYDGSDLFNVLNIDTISKSFGDQTLLSATGFRINNGERVGLVGRNGHGKTTLLNMIIGNDQPDEGQITCPSGYRIGYLSQKIEFSCHRVIEEAMLGLQAHEKEFSWKAEKILAGLGFSLADMQKDPLLFSGGYQVRLNLAKVLVSEPDLLILDEPTNYLDITSIRWISKFLNDWPREVLLVTHDRGFMDAVVTHIAGIHRQKIKKIKGKTSKYYLQIAQDEDIYEKTRLNEEKKRKEVEQFITRFRAKARLANMVQSRIKSLEKTKAKDKLEQLKSLDFSFNYHPFTGKHLMLVEDLSFGWEKHAPLFESLCFNVYPEDRIGIIGQNGKGKTTLLKLLNQSLKPGSGHIKINPGVSYDYFEQTNVQSLNPNFTIEQELMLATPDADRQMARNICGAMMFEQDAALKKISVLSGGEKARVMLGKLLMAPLNLLLLDEPSNHLDMESCDAFIAALDQFKGAVLIVTHNEMFLHSIANRLIVFNNDQVYLFEGTYQAFLEKQGWEENESKPVEKNIRNNLSKRELRQKKSEIIKEKSKWMAPVKKRIEQIEKQIEMIDMQMAQTENQLLAASEDQDGAKIQTLSKDLAGYQNENESLYAEYEIQMETFDSLEKKYSDQLDQLEKETYDG
jgi:ATP-binding cassette subfamily F protein 3